ncbi:MAG: hypothetical protein AAF086_03620 [Planctomycetota bacterium]
MTDASNPPANDLEAQLEALMKQAREGGGAADAEAQAESESDTATAVADEPQAATQANVEAQPAPQAPADLASQLDSLMAKVGSDSAEPTADDTPAQEEAAAPEALGTDVIADGPAKVEDAFDDLQGAFDAVQDVIAELEDEPAAQDQAPAEPESMPEPDASTETEAELQQRDDDLAAQLQSLLDEASAEEAESFVSPEELMDESAADEDEDDELDGDVTATVDDVIAAAQAPSTPEPTSDPEPAEGDPPLIDQLDSLLADHAEDAISGEFESVDELLGVSETASEDGDAFDTQDEDDDLGGDFQSMDDLLAKPEPEVEAKPEDHVEVKFPPPAPRNEEPAKELDEIDGLFEAPQAVVAAPTPEAEADEAPAFESDDDQDADGGFESLDALFAAPPPSIEDRDGAPPKAKAKTKAKRKAKSDAEGWSITLNLAVLQAAAALLLGWTLWSCAMVNKPIDKLPDEIKQTVGWVALAVAGPGVLLVAYGLLFN